MDIAEALQVLSLPPAPSWPEIRQAHRDAIVAVHPDTGGSSASAARVNQALDTLARATDHGRQSLAPTPPGVSELVSTPKTPSRLSPDQDPTEVLLRLADAAHDIGEVVFVDPDAGLLEVIVGVEPGVGQLTATVDPANHDGVPVAFTLEALGIVPAPPIEDVVQSLMARLRVRSGFEHSSRPSP